MYIKHETIGYQILIITALLHFSVLYKQLISSINDEISVPSYLLVVMVLTYWDSI